MIAAIERQFQKPSNRATFRIVLLIVCSILAWAALIFPLAIRQAIAPIKVGDVADQDVQATHDLTFVSDILTQQARSEASSKVDSIYLPTDPAITRGQIENLRVALNYITAVRFDSYATLDQKVSDIQKLDSVVFDPDIITEIINLSDSHWQTIQQESVSVMEQVMRRTIRDDQVAEARRSIPTLISFSLDEEEANLVNQIVSPFVSANSLFSQELTDQARTEASAAVEPVTRTFLSGETIVRRGQIINELAYEALDQYNLVRQDNQQQVFWASAILVALMAVFVTLYFNHRPLPVAKGLKSLLLIGITFLLFLYLAKMVVPNRTVVPYIFPVSAFALTLASLFSLETAIVFPLVLTILIAYDLPNSLDLTIFHLLTSLVGVLILGKGRRIANYFWAGIAIGLSGSAVILAYRLIDNNTDWLGIATLSGAAFLNGIAAASITLLLQYLFSQLLGLTTSLQMMDLLRPDHPLLQHMLREMPGSYQHSLQVANLAEQAAEVIGADALLTRAGAIYHDAGKSLNPTFFIENQVQGKIDSHDELDPRQTAQIIIQHVHDGILLARKYRLPVRLQDFMLEHHGTMVTRYQYTQAVKAANGDESQVNIEDFRYPGPSPQSRETAILMLADGVEARARAEIPKDEEELRVLIRKVVDYCQKEGQLDNTTLTMRDLTLIVDSFVKTLRNTYHARIKYPELKPAANDNQISPATQPISDRIPTK
jgi:putative nucleotidyltransferase with HDIG domain